MRPTTLDLAADAHEVMREFGLEPEFPEQVEREVRSLSAGLPVTDDEPVRDLRSWLWSSIDNPDSRDLDQLEYAERAADGTIRLYVAIADVASRVARGSATDEHASTNTVSVYTGVRTFPMLPERLSTDLTSLNPKQDRLAVVTELHVAPNGTVGRTAVFRAIVRSEAKLDYPSVGAWLQGQGELPRELADNPALEEQLRWQDDAAQRLDNVRERAGALNIETVEARPVMANGRIIDIAVVETNRARDLIENLMIAANVAMARYLAGADVPRSGASCASPTLIASSKLLKWARPAGGAGQPGAVSVSRSPARC
jgi:exoribonuclease-2